MTGSSKEGQANEAWNAVATLALVRACAASWNAEARIIGNLHACDILRAIDATLPLLDGELEPWRSVPDLPDSAGPVPDGAPPEEVLAYLLVCALRWSPEARIIGTVTAGEIRAAVLQIMSLPQETGPEHPTCV